MADNLEQNISLTEPQSVVNGLLETETSQVDDDLTEANQKKDGNQRTFENILIAVGHSGRFQMYILLLGVLASGNVNYQNTSTVFTLTTPKHRCQIPGVNNDTFTEQGVFHSELIERFIPKGSNGRYKKCELLDPSSTFNDTSYTVSGESNQSELKEKRMACSEWVYDKSVMTRTLVSDLNLICDDKVVRSHANMVLFFGKMSAAFLQGTLSDRFGRRRVLIATLTGTLVMAIGFGFVYNRITLLIARFFAGFFATANYLSVFVLAVEFLGIEQRARFAIFITFISGFWDGSMSLLAYLYRDWQPLQLSLALPAFIGSLVCWFAPESPRWLLSKERVEDAKQTFKKIAKINRRPIPSGLVEQVYSKKLVKPGEQSVLRLFTDWRLAFRYLILYLNWIAMCMASFGLNFTISNMKGNIFLNFAIGGFLDTTVSLIVSYIINKVPRNRLYVSLMMVTSVACIGTLIPILLDAPVIVVVGLSLLGKATASSCYPVLYTFSAELFPTPYRGSGVGSCSLMSRLGGLLSPYVADLNLYATGKIAEVLPQIVVGSFAILGGLTALILPETKGRELPETIEDIKETFASKKHGLRADKATKGQLI